MLSSLDILVAERAGEDSRGIWRCANYPKLLSRLRFLDGTGEWSPGQPGSQDWPNTLGPIFILIVKTMFPGQLEVGGVLLAAFASKWVWC